MHKKVHSSKKTAEEMFTKRSTISATTLYRRNHSQEKVFRENKRRNYEMNLSRPAMAIYSDLMTNAHNAYHTFDFNEDSYYFPWLPASY